MRFEVDFSQPSTLRGAVWLIVSIIGLLMVAQGKDVTNLLLLGAGVAGGLGVGVDDKPH